MLSPLLLPMMCFLNAVQSGKLTVGGDVKKGAMFAGSESKVVVHGDVNGTKWQEDEGSDVVVHGRMVDVPAQNIQNKLTDHPNLYLVVRIPGNSQILQLVDKFQKQKIEYDDQGQKDMALK